MLRTNTVLVIAALVGGLTACDQSKDVSDESTAWGNYERGAKYITKRDLFLIKIGQDEPKYALVPEGSFKGKVRHLYPRPESVEDYLETKKINYEKYIAYNLPIEVVGIIKAGSVLAAEKVEYFQETSWFFGTAEYYRVYGRLDIPNFSKYLVDLEDVSNRNFGGTSSCCRNHSPLEGVLEILSPNKAPQPTPKRGAAELQR